MLIPEEKKRKKENSRCRIKETSAKINQHRPVGGTLTSAMYPQLLLTGREDPSGRVRSLPHLPQESFAYSTIQQEGEHFSPWRIAQPIGDCSSPTNGQAFRLWTPSFSNGSLVITDPPNSPPFPIKGFPSLFLGFAYSPPLFGILSCNSSGYSWISSLLLIK